MSQYTIQLPSGVLDISTSKEDIPLLDICGFAARENSKREFLFISKVLGKHYPVKPSVINHIHKTLASKINHLEHKKCLFVGFCETATALAQGIYNNSAVFDKYYFQTTRHHFENNLLFTFQEEHSHATDHLIYNSNNQDISNYDHLILIDDELTTGNTIINFINQFLKTITHELKSIYIISIKNWIPQSKISDIQSLFNNIDIHFVQLIKGEFVFYKHNNFHFFNPLNNRSSENKDYISTANFGRFGYSTPPDIDISFLNSEILPPSKEDPFLILGVGEFIYYPYQISMYLEEQGYNVYYQSTTQSPIFVSNDISSKIEFKDNYNDNISHYLYNVSPYQYKNIMILYDCQSFYDFKIPGCNIHHISCCKG